MLTADTILSQAENYAFKRGFDTSYYTGSVRQVARSISEFMTSRKLGYDVSALDAVARGEIKSQDQIDADIRRSRPKGTRMSTQRYGGA